MAKISGTLSNDARVLIVKETDWSLESNTEKSAGAFEVDGLDAGKKMLIARKSDGETIGFGNVNTVASAGVWLDDDFTGAGVPADENKWVTAAFPVDTDGSNLPKLRANELYWNGTKTAEGSGEELYRVYSKAYLPLGQNSWEIECEINITTLLTTGDASYEGPYVQFGVSPTPNLLNPTWNNMITVHRRPSYLPEPAMNLRILNQAASGMSFSYQMLTNSYNLTNIMLLKLRIRREKHPSNATIRTGMMFFDKRDSNWKNVDGTIDTYWYGVYENDRDAYMYFTFSTSTIFRNYTGEIKVGINYFRLLSGNFIQP